MLRTPRTHYHLVCRSCGTVVEFTSPVIEELKAAVGRAYDYDIAEVQADLLGTCPACRAAAGQAPAGESSGPRAETGAPDAVRRPARPADEGRSLATLTPGSVGRVAALTGGHELVARLAALGLTPGTALEVSQNPGQGPVIVLVRDTRLVLGRGEAGHVLVTAAEARDGKQPA